MHYSEIIVDKQYQDFNPITFGYERCKPGHSYGPAVRTFWLLHYVRKGHGTFTRDHVTHTVEAGEIFVIPPFLTTFYQASETDPWEYTWIGFTAAQPLPSLLQQPVIRSPRAEPVFTDMQHCRYMNGGKTAYLCSRLWELMSLFWEEDNREPDYAEKALNLIRSEYMYGITVQQIARRLNIDRSYLYTLFKEKTGQSPQQYLVQYRMEQAVSLMTVNRRSPSIAAFSVGYNDLYTFSKMFKQIYGVSPREYIRRYRQKHRL